MRKIKGILFDFDGVIADSEKLWFSSAISTLKKMNIAYDKSINQKSTIGIISEHLFKILITDKEFDLSKIMKTYQQVLKKTFKEHSPMIYPHLKKFIRSTDYVIGSKKLNLKPNEILVIEDSDVGIEAALKAKVKKVLRHTNNDKNLPVKIKHHVTKLLNYKNFGERFI